MKELKYYLTEAKDYMEGYQAVERLVEFYTQDPQKAEKLWRKAILDHEDSVELLEFEGLLDKQCLFVQYETAESMHNHFAVSSTDKEVYFAIRLYSYNIPFSKVPVLKAVFP